MSHREDGIMHTNDDRITLTRRIYTKEAFDARYPVEYEETNKTECLKRAFQCNRRKIGKICSSYFPIVKTISKYKPRKFAMGDVLAGLTVSFMHLPQAMGFGILASLKPVYGLYGTFFSVITYIIFGTSPYISFGTNAVMALLTQTVVDREADSFVQSFTDKNITGPTEDEIMAVKINAAMACCLLVGIILTAMGVFKLGVVTTYLSVSFIGGFTTAAAVHIASSQVPKAFGIQVKSFSGAGKLIRMYVDLFSKIKQVNDAEIIIAIVCILILIVVKTCVNERFKDKMKIPIPIDLIVVILGTIISHFGHFDSTFGVKCVGPIPSGFQSPVVPSMSNAGNFASNAFVMAILSLAMSISLAKLCAEKHGKPIDNNQELIAYGACNIVSSFFFSFPSATAPPRTMILSSLGAKTTLNGCITAVFILLVILVIGPLFVSLPMSVLAAMIIVSMKELLFQYKNLPNIWRVNKYDFFIWVITNLISIFVDLDYGIIAGVGVSIFLTVLHDQVSSGHVIDISKNEDIVLGDCESSRNKRREIQGIKSFRLPTSLYFATADSIKSQIFKKVLDPRAYKKSLRVRMKSITNSENAEEDLDISSGDSLGNAQYGKVDINSDQDTDNMTDVKSVILDCVHVTYIDMAGIAALRHVVKEYKDISVNIYLIRVENKVYDTLEAAGFFKDFSKTRVFIDIFDVIAILSGQSEC
ncbi:hypothetical protein ACF0H5_001315 [Mactra antiquata]